jgi:hypothetical protein
MTMLEGIMYLAQRDSVTRFSTSDFFLKSCSAERTKLKTYFVYACKNVCLQSWMYLYVGTYVLCMYIKIQFYVLLFFNKDNLSSVSNPHWFQCGFVYGSGTSILSQCWSGCGSGSGSRSRVFMSKFWKNYSWKRNSCFLIKNCNLLIPRPPYRTSKPQKRISSTSKLEMFTLFSIFWVIVALLDPDPDPADQNQYGSGSETLNLSHE